MYILRVYVWLGISLLFLLRNNNSSNKLALFVSIFFLFLPPAAVAAVTCHSVNITLTDACALVKVFYDHCRQSFAFMYLLITYYVNFTNYVHCELGLTMDDVIN